MRVIIEIIVIFCPGEFSALLPPGPPALSRRKGVPSPAQQESSFRSFHVQLFIPWVKNPGGKHFTCLLYVLKLLGRLYF